MKHCVSKKRSRNMSRIRSADTKPELVVRRLLFSMGYRYRVHVRDLPGCPDVVFSKRRKLIFIHGCFWHRHNCRKGRSLPSTRTDFWQKKLLANAARDKATITKLRKKGWKVLVVWECELKPAVSLQTRLSKFLGPPRLS